MEASLIYDREPQITNKTARSNLRTGHVATHHAARQRMDLYLRCVLSVLSRRVQPLGRYSTLPQYHILLILSFCRPTSAEICPFPWGVFNHRSFIWAHPSHHPKRHIHPVGRFSKIHGRYERTTDGQNKHGTQPVPIRCTLYLTFDRMRG